MTIDERLEKLAERHEALTQTVELMMAENRDREKADREREKLNRDRAQAVDRTMDQIMEGMARLLHIAEIHEHRIERLEGQ